ncbi:MAG: hypothetical protein Q8O46_02800 [bacterium]|nr:hypothetical protein [bacterium]
MVNLNSYTNISYRPENGSDIEEIFGIIKKQRLGLSMLYESDILNLEVRLNDNDGNNLFAGISSAGINPPQDGVSQNQLDVMFEMNSYLWLPFSSAKWFRIIERDENGNPIRFFSSEEWDIQNGKIRFPGYFSRKAGEIVVTIEDDIEVAYALNGGKKITPIGVKVGIGNIAAFGVRTLRNISVDSFEAVINISQEEIQRNVNPLIQLVNDIPEGFKSSMSMFAQLNRSGCRPGDIFSPTTGEACRDALPPEFSSVIFIWLPGQSESQAEKLEVGPSNFFYLPAGSYWAKFAFPSGWPNGQNQFSPPWRDDGHKGDFGN